MRFFAIALVPGGNILAHVSGIKSRTWSIAGTLAGSAAGLALPEAVYLGFFEAQAKGLKKELVRLFKREAQGLFAGLPERLHFGEIRWIGENAYLAPIEELPRALVENARVFAREAGLRELENTPIVPGIGFFMPGGVTLSPADAFSFSNMQALLLELHSPNARWESAVWRVLCRQARRWGSIEGQSAA